MKMQQIVNVTIDESGRSIADSKSIGLQYETGVAQFVIAPDPSWVSDQYFYYVIVSPPEDSEKKQYAVPLVNQGGTFVFKISSGITWTVGNYKFAFIAMSKELTDGRVPSDGIVSISTAWNCKIEKSILDYVSLQSQPADANFQLLYTDLMALSVEVRNQANYVKEQGDYANEQATLAKNAIAEVKDATQHANTQGNYAKGKGDFANEQGNYAKEQGNYAKTQAESAYTEAEYATNQGKYAKNQGDYAKEQGDYANTQALAAKEKGNNAETQANYAKEQGDYAKTQGQYAEQQGTYAKTQGDYAKTQGTNAQTQANNASTQAKNAQTQATYAQTQGDYAKRVGDTVQGQIDRLRANQVQGRANGTELVVQDSAEMESILHLNGNSEQDSRSGYNLYNYKNKIYPANTNGLTSVINADGTVTTTGTPTGSYATVIDDIYITDILEDGQTYTVGQTVASDNSAYIQINAIKSDGSGTTYFNPSLTKKTARFTVDKTTYSKYVVRVQTGSLSNMTTPVNFTAGYMILKGSYTDDTLPKFEPYGVQPSPDYPSPIRSVSGDVEVKVEGMTQTGDYVERFYQVKLMSRTKLNQ